MSWVLIGAAWGFLAVALGAFGAHALALLLTGTLGLLGARIDAAGWCFLAGSAIFSGTLYAMTLGAPRLLGAITPLGGLLLLAGWLALGWAARSLPGRP